MVKQKHKAVKKKMKPKKKYKNRQFGTDEEANTVAGAMKKRKK